MSLESTLIVTTALFFKPYVKNVTFGKNLRTISYDFIGYGCKSLTTYKVAAANKYYSDAKGLLYDKKKTVLKAYPFGSKAKKLTILKTVKYVNVFDDFLKETKVQKFAVEKGNKWYTVRKKFIPDMEMYDQFMIGASQISGYGNYIAFDYINIKELNSGE